MNNFVFSQDPLLYSTTVPQYQPTDMDIKKQLDTVMAQYQALQQQKPPQAPEYQEDHIGSLDSLVRGLDPVIAESLGADQEFIQLNSWIQQAIQNEIMKGVKIKLNSNPEVIAKVNRAKEIVNELKTIQDNEDRKSLIELNDYVQNYSDMTFKEYKQLKQSKQLR
jgi:hypothetical protein